MTSTHWVIYAILFGVGLIISGPLGVFMMGVAGGLALHFTISVIQEVISVRKEIKQSGAADT